MNKYKGNLLILPKTDAMIRTIVLCCLLIFTGCQMKKEHVDLMIKDATVYTVDEVFTVVEAFVVKNGRIHDAGTTAEMEKRYRADETRSLKNHFVYPGWNDAHCHFVGYGLSLNQVDLAGTSSVEDILQRCKAFAESNPDGWITGRGWDQNDWQIKEFPTKSDLDQLFPDRPVLLRRVDGHAGWTNTRALEIAEVTAESRIDGGDVMVKNGEPTGILIDNAIGLVSRQIPEPVKEELKTGLLRAQQNCFAVGLTSVSDAGLATEVVQLIDTMQKEGSLKMRINAWLDPSESNFKTFIEKGTIQNDHLSISTLKLYADGALGSRGALMLEPYSDDPGNSGLLLTEPALLEELCRRAHNLGYQVAVHCIGDAANRLMLGIYSGILEKGNDRRWRIEHAQIIHPEDFKLFGEYNIIPSVQPTHATSDMYWAEDRLGSKRMAGAYSYKTLLNQMGWIPNGSDFPVEHINPLFGFYAAVARKDHEGYPAEGFIMQEALSREEALRAMTIWAAKAAFEEHLKGSLEKNKLADFVITKEDIMTVPERSIPGIEVVSTYSGGELVYSNESLQ
jgi:predicted amidohydrolase YtcJ